MPSNNFGHALARFPKLAEQRQKIADEIVRRMETGDFGHWIQSFTPVGIPYNPITGNQYRGSNRANLSLIALIHGYSDPRWVTWKGAKSQGWKIKDGEEKHYSHIEHWRKIPLYVEDEHGDTILDDNGKPTLRGYYYRLDRYYLVYNGDQIDGIPPAPTFDLKSNNDLEVGVMADRLKESSRCKIEEVYTPNAPNYSMSRDEIEIPSRTQYEDNEAFVGDLLHEMAHSTAHSSALGRELFSHRGEGYAHEELIAELSAIFSCAELSLPAESGLVESSRFGNHVAYLAGWAKAISDDPKVLYAAVAAADSATGYIIKRYDDILSEHGEKRAVLQEIERCREHVQEKLDYDKTPSVMSPTNVEKTADSVEKNFVSVEDVPFEGVANDKPAAYGTRHVDMERIIKILDSTKKIGTAHFGHRTEQEMREALERTGDYLDFEIDDEIAEIKQMSRLSEENTSRILTDNKRLEPISKRDVAERTRLHDFNARLDELEPSLYDDGLSDEAKSKRAAEFEKIFDERNKFVTDYVVKRLEAGLGYYLPGTGLVLTKDNHNFDFIFDNRDNIGLWVQQTGWSADAWDKKFLSHTEQDRTTQTEITSGKVANEENIKVDDAFTYNKSTRSADNIVAPIDGTDTLYNDFCDKTSLVQDAGSLPTDLQNACESIDKQLAAGAIKIQVDISSAKELTDLSNALLACGADIETFGHTITIDPQSFSSTVQLAQQLTNAGSHIYRQSSLRFEPSQTSEKALSASARATDFEHDIARAQTSAHEQTKSQQQELSQTASR